MAKGIERIRTGWSRFWYGDVDAIRLSALQQGLAFTLLIYVVTWSRNAEEWLTAAGFHPSTAADAYNAPQLPLLPPALLPVAGVLFFGSLAAFVFGIKRRITTVLVLLCVVYITWVDQISAFTLNRLFIITFLIFSFAPPARPSSTGDDDADGPALQTAWPLRMVQVLLVCHYFASGLCKLIQGDWGKGNDVLWTQLQGFYMTDFAAWLVRTVPMDAIALMQHSALGFELAAPLLFGIRRLRPLAFAYGIGFHIVIALCMYQLIFFSAQMIALYLVFVPPAWLHRAVARLR
jgi:hypothetical protein